MLFDCSVCMYVREGWKRGINGICPPGHDNNMEREREREYVTLT